MKLRKFFWLVGALFISIALGACNIGATPPPAQDDGAIQTQAFEIVLTQAALQQTQTAAAVPPTPLPTGTLAATITIAPLPTSGTFGETNTPFAFNTQQPGLTPQLLITPTSIAAVNTITTQNGCNDGAYIGETKPFDGDSIKVGAEFSKAWTILNTGTCTWDEGYVFDYLESYFPPETNVSQLAGYDIKLKKNAAEEYTKPKHTQSFVVKLKAPKTPGQYKGYWKLRDDAGNYFGPLVYVWIIAVP
ncbi:MAG: hypothetical protein KF758_08695 [Anaerolineales bacterium]|nr:hypothetical protein [Anaerolineales bacterium]MBX3036977.1 hypothetical protein [Anaerolineales bacterium]